MKHVTIALLALLLFLSCEETSNTNISVTDEFNTAVKGNMIAIVENEGVALNLKGTLDLIDGQFNIYLADPSGDTIYSKTFTDAGTHKVNEKFDRKIGNWIFSYNVVKVGDISPSGEFDFEITYND
jgi:hypothetical protein